MLDFIIDLSDFSKIASSLCDLLAKDACFDFNEECMKAFDELKIKLATTPIVQTQTGSYLLSLCAMLVIKL